MKAGIVTKVISMVLIAVLVSVGSMMAIGFFVNYSQVDAAAGEELNGCANITSGLLTKEDIRQLGQATSAELQAKVDWIVDHKPIFMNAGIIRTDGTILVADQRLQAQGLKAGDKVAVDENAIAMVQSMRHPAASDIYSFNGVERKTGYAPIFADHDPSGEIVALMTVDFNADIVSARTWEMLRYTLMTGGIFPILSAVAAFFVIRRMIRPIETISLRVKEIADGDLQGMPIREESRDELGALAQAVNRMTVNLRAIVTSIQETSRTVTGTTESLACDADRSLDAVHEMKSAVQQIASGAQLQEKSTRDSALAMEEIALGVNRIAASSVSVTELMQDTLGQAHRGGEALSRVRQRMDGIGASVESSSAIAEELKERSGQIEHIVQIMKDVAHQTNLLALNASIEASRAGEQGRGFAVVAAEIRKLAEQSRGSSEQVTELIESIRDQIGQLDEAMVRETSEVASGRVVVEELAEAFLRIVRQAEHTHDQITDISAVSEEISAGTQQVASSVQEMAAIAARSAAESDSVAQLAIGQLEVLEQMTEGAHRIERMNLELTEAASRFRLS
ncbi:methyl-accepting chemotaxis protein [Paenibacillus puerhi]|uniref:methyl-accepting chemotaxis protein n=1 Tax=Paenibacillus puerhi TaxID=2692622 RepID=UPI00135B38BE|nr:methyl-accepting chemotaxis protein [Paenibacillus puerhi]